MSSVVVDAIKLACTGVTHEARGALSGLTASAGSGIRYPGHGRAAGATFGTHECATLGSLFSRLNHFLRECPNDSCNKPQTN